MTVEGSGMCEEDSGQRILDAIAESQRLKAVHELCDAISQLNDKFPRPAMDPIQLSSFYSLSVSDDRRFLRGVRNPGVYVFVDETHNVMYVGKASCDQTLGERLRQHFNQDGTRKSDCAVASAHVAFIAVPQDRSYEAPAVEEFLVIQLTPPYNEHGRNPGWLRHLSTQN